MLELVSKSEEIISVSNVKHGASQTVHTSENLHRCISMQSMIFVVFRGVRFLV